MGIDAALLASGSSLAPTGFRGVDSSTWSIDSLFLGDHISVDLLVFSYVGAKEAVKKAREAREREKRPEVCFNFPVFRRDTILIPSQRKRGEAGSTSTFNILQPTPTSGPQPLPLTPTSQHQPLSLTPRSQFLELTPTSQSSGPTSTTEGGGRSTPQQTKQKRSACSPSYYDPLLISSWDRMELLVSLNDEL